MESSKWCTNVTFKSCVFLFFFYGTPIFGVCISTILCLYCIHQHYLHPKQSTMHYVLHALHTMCWIFDFLVLFFKNASNPTLPLCAKWKRSSYDANRTHLGICCRTHQLTRLACSKLKDKELKNGGGEVSARGAAFSLAHVWRLLLGTQSLIYEEKRTAL